MRILLTNDDGIHADGLAALERIARKLSDDVWVVAPEQEQSGAAHSLSLHLPVRVRKLGEKRYAVAGTPTDCVLLALKKIIPSSLRGGKADAAIHSKSKKLDRHASLAMTVDLVLSGINHGSNAGDDVTYSGTIAGAMEGTLLGVPSIALSQDCDDREHIDWKTAEKYAPALIQKLLKAGWPKGTLINLNFPDCAPAKVNGVRVCPHGKRLISMALTERVDPKGRPYYWLGGPREDTPDRKGVDIDFLAKGYITATPLNMDLTDYKTVKALGAVIA